MRNRIGLFIFCLAIGLCLAGGATGTRLYFHAFHTHERQTEGKGGKCSVGEHEDHVDLTPLECEQINLTWAPVILGFLIACVIAAKHASDENFKLESFRTYRLMAAGMFFWLVVIGVMGQPVSEMALAHGVVLRAGN